MDRKEENVLIKFGEKVLSAVPFKNIMYARCVNSCSGSQKILFFSRVDIVLPESKNDEDDVLRLSPLLMELELFEPSLYTGPLKARKNYVEAILGRLDIH